LAILTSCGSRISYFLKESKHPEKTSKNKQTLGSRNMYLTWLDSNSWLLELGNPGEELHILLDPWLVGPLSFGDWLFKAERPQDRPIPAKIDLILLSQGLPDHAHPPTLAQLDKSIPVIGSAAAIKVAQGLGFTNAQAVGHGQTHSFGSVQIQATVGSPVGPGTPENGYLLTDTQTGYRLYYEPHGYHDPRLAQVGPVDVVITPLVSLDLLFAPFIQGGKTALKVTEWLQPQVLMSTAAGGNVQFQGLLLKLLRMRDGVEMVRQALAAQSSPTQVLDPQPGERFQVPLQPRPIAVGVG
jgi:L-ascorbate metabolism protein UlaG (beta-lactamase superfamily)